MLQRAVAALTAAPGLALLAASPVYRTEPQEKADQPWFLNQVIALAVSPEIGPEALLETLLRIEAELGRVRPFGAGQAERFEPRVIDLDLLLYGSSAVDLPGCVLPHPRMRRRAFVLLPLRDIAPDLVFPDQETLAQAIEKISFAVHKGIIRQ